MEHESKAFTGTRRGDGGTYLIIADNSDEFEVAMHYACALAITRRGHVAVAHITDLEDFVHWGKVEAMMRNDLRAEAEQEIWQIAKTIFSRNRDVKILIKIRNVKKDLNNISNNKNSREFIKNPN